MVSRLGKGCRELWPFPHRKTLSPTAVLPCPGPFPHSRVPLHRTSSVSETMRPSREVGTTARQLSTLVWSYPLCTLALGPSLLGHIYIHAQKYVYKHTAVTSNILLKYKYFYLLLFPFNFLESSSEGCFSPTVYRNRGRKRETSM